MAITSSVELIADNRQEAISLGLKKYWGEKCIKDHNSPRYVVNAGCIKCTSEKYKKYYKKNGKKWLKTQRDKYASDSEYREKIRENALKSREKNKEKQNQRRRERYRNDPEYREKVLSERRGRDQRHIRLKSIYGITVEEYQDLLDSQDGKCKICQEKKKETLCVDHCHDSGVIRGLLCRKCNTGLGCYEDDIEKMKRAIKYLENFCGY